MVLQSKTMGVGHTPMDHLTHMFSCPMALKHKTMEDNHTPMDHFMDMEN